MCLTLGGGDMHVLNGWMLIQKAYLLSLVAEASSKLTLLAVANLWWMLNECTPTLNAKSGTSYRGASQFYGSDPRGGRHVCAEWMDE